MDETVEKVNPVRRYLESVGKTQEQLAREMDVSFVFVNGILNGKRTDLRISRLVALHRATGVPYLELIDFFHGTH